MAPKKLTSRQLTELWETAKLNADEVKKSAIDQTPIPFCMAIDSLAECVAMLRAHFAACTLKGNAPCIACGRNDLPLHTDYKCPNCSAVPRRNMDIHFH